MSDAQSDLRATLYSKNCPFCKETILGNGSGLKVDVDPVSGFFGGNCPCCKDVVLFGKDMEGLFILPPGYQKVQP